MRSSLFVLVSGKVTYTGIDAILSLLGQGLALKGYTLPNRHLPNSNGLPQDIFELANTT